MTCRTPFVHTSIALALIAAMTPLTVTAEYRIREETILVKGVPGLGEAGLAKILERYEARAERRLVDRTSRKSG